MCATFIVGTGRWYPRMVTPSSVRTVNSSMSPYAGAAWRPPGMLRRREVLQLALERERERAHAHVPDRGRLGHPGGDTDEQTAEPAEHGGVRGGPGAAAADAVIVPGWTPPAGSMRCVLHPRFDRGDAGSAGSRGTGGSRRARGIRERDGGARRPPRRARERVWGRLGVGPDVTRARRTAARATGLSELGGGSTKPLNRNFLEKRTGSEVASEAPTQERRRRRARATRLAKRSCRGTFRLFRSRRPPASRGRST